jgi:hypothetical protein
MFFVGVLIVLVGLSLLVSAQVEAMRLAGQAVGGPEGWAKLIEAIADLWGTIISSVEQGYRVGLTVLVIGAVVMVLPIALPMSKS